MHSPQERPPPPASLVFRIFLVLPFSPPALPTGSPHPLDCSHSEGTPLATRGLPEKTAAWLLSVPFRPAARFLFHPRHRSASGRRALLGCLRAHHTRGKPWSRMETDPSQRRPACGGRAALPADAHMGVLTASDFGGGPTRPRRASGRPSGERRATVSLVSLLGFFLLLCILLAISYPVWESQGHP